MPSATPRAALHVAIPPLFLIGAAVVPAGAAHGQQPTVVTEFVIDANALALSDPARAQVETELSTTIALAAGHYFPHLEWVSAHDTPLRDRRLIVTARQITVPVGGHDCHGIDLVFAGGMAPGDRPSALSFKERAFSLCEPLPSSAGDLELRMTRILNDLIDNEDFREHTLFDDFVGRISLASTFHLHELEQRVVLPLRWESLSADPVESRLEIVFRGGALDVVGRFDSGRELLESNNVAWIGLASWSPFYLRIAGDEIFAGRFQQLSTLRQSGPVTEVAAFLKPYARIGRSHCEDLDECQ